MFEPLSVESALALLQYLLAVFGLCYIIGHSKITLGLRTLFAGVPAQQELRAADGAVLLEARPGIKPLIPFLGPFLVELAECPACLSFWIGFASGGAHHTNTGQAVHLALVTTASSFILARVTGLMGMTAR